MKNPRKPLLKDLVSEYISKPFIQHQTCELETKQMQANFSDMEDIEYPEEVEEEVTIPKIDCNKRLLETFLLNDKFKFLQEATQFAFDRDLDDLGIDEGELFREEDFMGNEDDGLLSFSSDQQQKVNGNEIYSLYIIGLKEILEMLSKDHSK